MLNTISAYWHMAGSRSSCSCCIVVPDHHRSFWFVFTGTLNNSGFVRDGRTSARVVFWYVFGLGLLLSQYTITGFDASAHMAEETQAASRMAAVGMYMSVVASVVFGWILLLAVTFAMPSTRGRRRRGQQRGRLHLAGVDEPELGRAPAVHLLHRADVLPDRLGHVGVAHDVRVLARRRMPGHSGGGRSAATASRTTPSVAIGVLSWALMVPTILERVRRLLVGTRSP